MSDRVQAIRYGMFIMPFHDPDMTVHDHTRKPVPIAHGGKALNEILL